MSIAGADARGASLVGFGLDRLALSLVADPRRLARDADLGGDRARPRRRPRLLAAPTTSLVASFFLDEIADLVEREVDPCGPPGRPAPALRRRFSRCASPLSPRWSLLVALVLLFVPGFGFAAWIAANAYLFGSEYFELAAMRFHPVARRGRCAAAFAAPVYFAGLIISGFVAIPLSICSRRCSRRR